MTSRFQSFARLLLPSALVVLLAWFLARSAGATLPAQSAMLGAISVTAVAAMLAARFHCLRIFLALLSFVGFELFFLIASHAQSVPPAAAHLWAGVLLAAHLLLLLAVTDEFFDWQAAGWWAVFAAASWALLLLATLLRWSQLATIPSLDLQQLGRWDLCWLALFTAALAWIVRLLVAPECVSAGLLWAALATAMALHLPHLPSAAIMFAAAALVMGIAVVERSFWISYHDELTGLPGRRAFNETVASLDGDFAIAIVDVDHFKKFNDTYGHETGDQVLRKVAAQLARVSGGGRAFRCGGEEFALVFPRYAAAHALPYAEEVRRAIESDVFVVRGPDRSSRPREERRNGNRAVAARPQNTGVTVSMGIAEPSRRLPAAREVIEAADQALYLAKQNGRNRIEVAQPAPRRRRVPEAQPVNDAQTGRIPAR